MVFPVATFSHSQLVYEQKYTTLLVSFKVVSDDEAYEWADDS